MTTELEDEVSRITVRRSHIWADSMRVLRRVHLEKRLKVTFLGESAVDDGGPRREYLRLLMSTMAEQSSLFTGPPSCKVPVHNAMALQRGDFHIVGVAIVLSLSQGGPGPTFFAPSVVDYLFGGISKVKPRVEDIPDCEVQEKLSKVNKILVYAY